MHGAVRILSYAIASTLDLKSRSVRIRVQSGLCTENLMSLQCSFTRTENFLTAKKTQLSSLKFYGSLNGCLCHHSIAHSTLIDTCIYNITTVWTMMLHDIVCIHMHDMTTCPLQPTVAVCHTWSLRHN